VSGHALRSPFMRTYGVAGALITPWTPDRQARGVATLESIGALACAPERVLAWNDHERPDPDAASVVYWMARSQRGTHNLALDCAVDAARALDLPLLVVLRLVPGPTGTELRHVDVLARGLADAFDDCRARGAHCFLVQRDGPALEEAFGAAMLRPALVVTDDDVMPRARAWRARVAGAIGVPLVSVDADVVVPGACFPKQEYAARTIRPKLHRVLDRFVDELGAGRQGPSAPARPAPPGTVDRAGLTAIVDEGDVDSGAILAAAREFGTPATAGPIPEQPSGTRAAQARLAHFVAHELPGYALARNKPELDATSRLSAFSHFGQLSPHEIVRAVRASGAPAADIATFIEEFVVRRELAHNFVRWNPRAHQLAGAPDWARATLESHRGDPREWLWDDDVLEAGDTHDPLWNAAQRQLVERGHMHGYVRMYWAKKLLEWRADPADAFDIALRLNDRWQLDGRDPNGITGVAWAIGGVHDRPWGERPIFGMVRYMSLASTGRKFDSRAFVESWGGLRGAALDHPGRYARRTGPSLF